MASELATVSKECDSLKRKVQMLQARLDVQLDQKVQVSAGHEFNQQIENLQQKLDAANRKIAALEKDAHVRSKTISEKDRRYKQLEKQYGQLNMELSKYEGWQPANKRAREDANPGSEEGLPVPKARKTIPQTTDEEDSDEDVIEVDAAGVSEKMRNLTLRPSRQAAIDGQAARRAMPCAMSLWKFQLISPDRRNKQILTVSGPEFGALPTQLQSKIREAYDVCVEKHGEAWYLDPYFNTTPKDRLCMVSKHSGVTTSWRDGDNGEYACRRCVDNKRVCITWNGRFLVLPLHQEDRFGIEAGGGSDASIWVNS